MSPSDTFKNILVIKPGAIGDVLQLTPVIRALKSAFPRAGISLLVGSAGTADLFRFNPRVAETIVFDKKGAHSSLRPLLRLWGELQRRRFDLVLNFQRSNLKAWFLAGASFPCRLLVYHKARNRTVHAVVNHLETIAPLGIASGDLELDLEPGPEATAFAGRLLDDFSGRGGPLIAMNPGASHPLKQWSPGQFAALADILARERSARILIVGGPDDLPLSREIAGQTASAPLVLTGKLDLLQLGAVLKKCDVLVSGDTGPLHVSTAVGTPVAGLFGPTDPARTGPVGRGHRVIQARDVPCVPCKSLTCRNARYQECMQALSPEQAHEAICDMLNGEKASIGNTAGDIFP